MKRFKERWYLIVIVLGTLAIQVTAVAPFKKVSIATTTSTTSTEASSTAAEEIKSENGTSSGPTKNSKLTGIPQIDYIWDPNLPRELRGYNLSSYPFFSTVPPEEDIHFKCDGLHDGFYASIEHKCQVYHHCVYGIRHDFLCANFTAFDQKTFICHFVSDVDCEGSQKYWNRNDDLYMATTTTSTTTTTTEPPPTQRRRVVRPLRPLRRPSNRRPVDDYYYDDEEYDDEYYEERMNSRRKQHRPRHRKPQPEYDEEYEEKRSFSEDEKPRRPNSRDRFRDSEPDMEEDYDNERPKVERPKAHSKGNVPAERRKAGARRPVSVSGRSGADERRSFADEKPSSSRKDKHRSAIDETSDSSETYPRRSGSAARRRGNEKRPTPTPSTAADIDDLDYYEKPHSISHEQEENVEEEIIPKAKTTAKPLEEFITPKAATASVYARPRAPPRIPRPVPVNEKKKYEYPVQKATATTANPEDEYEDYEEHAAEAPARPHSSEGRRRTVDEIADDFPVGRRRPNNDTPFAGRKPSRKTLRKPLTDKKPTAVVDDDYEVPNEHFEGRINVARKRPYSNRARAPLRGAADVDFVDDDYEEQPKRPAHRLRPKTSARKSYKKLRPAVNEEEEEFYEAEEEPAPEPEPELPIRHRANTKSNINHHRSTANVKSRQPTVTEASAHKNVDKLESDVEEEEGESHAAASKTLVTSSGRPASVRVVKRPFLPSRGGSPYLPRGLQPVGVAHKSHAGVQTTDSTPIDMGSTISGVRLLEHGAPILRDSGSNQFAEVGLSSTRTTLPPRSALAVIPQTGLESQSHKATLDELYETDYDVTINDALNPTLKPLPIHHHHSNRNYASAFASSAPSTSNSFVNNNQSPAVYHNINYNNNKNNNNENENYEHQHQIAYQTLSPHQPQSQTSSPHQTQSHNQHQHQTSSNNFNSDSYFSSTDIRRRAIIVPAPKAHSSRSTEYRGVGTRIAQHFYDDFDY